MLKDSLGNIFDCTLRERIKSYFDEIVYSNGGGHDARGFQVQEFESFHIDAAVIKPDESLAVLSTVPTTIFASTFKGNKEKPGRIPSNDLIEWGLFSLMPGAVGIMFCIDGRANILHSTPYLLPDLVINQGCKQIAVPEGRSFFTFSYR